MSCRVGWSPSSGCVSSSSSWVRLRGLWAVAACRLMDDEGAARLAELLDGLQECHHVKARIGMYAMGSDTTTVRLLACHACLQTTMLGLACSCRRNKAMSSGISLALASTGSRCIEHPLHDCRHSRAVLGSGQKVQQTHPPGAEDCTMDLRMDSSSIQ